jgi:hypothetical protein
VAAGILLERTVSGGEISTVEQLDTETAAVEAAVILSG